MYMSVPTIVETSITGYLGTISVARGTVLYEVKFFNTTDGKLAAAYRNSLTVDLDFNAIVRKLVRTGSEIFSNV